MADIKNTTDALSQYRPEATRQAAGKTKDNEMGRDTFLKLMVTQMKNQNPLNPTDNQAFVAQLAQFSTVEGIGKLNTTFDQVSSTFNSTSALQASSLVGQSVVVEGNETGWLFPKSLVSSYADVPANASQMTLTIEDGSGKLLEQIPLGSHEKGPLSLRWDGKRLYQDGRLVDLSKVKLNRTEVLKDKDGKPILDADGKPQIAPYPIGQYAFKVSANIGGKVEALDMKMSARVDSVTMNPGGQVTLNLTGGQQANMKDIKQILDI